MKRTSAVVPNNCYVYRIYAGCSSGVRFGQAGVHQRQSVAPSEELPRMDLPVFRPGHELNAGSADHVMFTNVFVPQWAYAKFMKSGKWPDKTVFVVEERVAETKGSINKVGHFQTDLMGYGVEVKDETRFPEKWAYFNFDEDSKSAQANPKTACWQCHEDHAAVEHSFVQFYPTLKPVAKKFGTYKEAAENP